MIAIIAILAAILFPVFAKARERARQASCQSNEKQIGLAILQYVQDNDETYPGGSPGVVQSGINQGASPGQGWAGAVSPYVKSIQLFHCPDDSTTGGSYDGYNYYPVSYGMNEYIANQTLASSTAPASTVLASETSGALAYLEYVDEGVSEVPGTYITLSPSTSGFPYHGCGSNCGGFDPSGQGGPDIYSGASKDNSGPVTALNAGSNAINATGGPQARHDPQTAPISGGSEYLLADGHVKYLRIQYVSSGYYPNSIPNLGTLVATYDPFDYNIPNHGY